MNGVNAYSDTISFDPSADPSRTLFSDTLRNIREGEGEVARPSFPAMGHQMKHHETREKAAQTFAGYVPQAVGLLYDLAKWLTCHAQAYRDGP
jgi:hypothetical protein